MHCVIFVSECGVNRNLSFRGRELFKQIKQVLNLTVGSAAFVNPLSSMDSFP